MNMKTEYLCKSRMKHILLIGTAMFLISPITLYAGVTVDLNTNTETGIMNVAQQQQTVKGIVKGRTDCPLLLPISPRRELIMLPLPICMVTLH